jgi:predicted aldo/keto reductase-like oxidoreductase
MAHGYFHHFAFSFHDEYTAFKDIVDSYDNWTFTQVLYNYMDIDRQAMTRGVKYAAEKGLGVVVMEPLRGGVLSKKPPEKVAMVWEKAPRQMSLSEWGLQWVWNHPEISVVLSGMSSMQQVQENIAAAERSGAGKFDQADIALINSVRKAYRDLFPVACSGCRYCMPCPNDVSISTIFEIYNEGLVYDIMTRAKLRYKDTLMEGHRADKCIDCNKCVEVCPQKIAIPEQLKKAHEILSAVK